MGRLMQSTTTSGSDWLGEEVALMHGNFVHILHVYMAEREEVERVYGAQT